MNLLSYTLTILLFIGPVILGVLGLPVEGDFKKLFFYPSFYILFIYTIYSYLTDKIDKSSNKSALYILFIAAIWLVANKLIGRSMSKMILINSMALPAMYYIFFQSVDDRDVFKSIKYIILFLFACNGLVAIYERITISNFFPFDMIRSDIDVGGIGNEMLFRSSAFLGHPLTNALIMAIIMIFILTSKMKTIKKIVLYSIGMFSLFCFNSRASILISVITLFLYFINPLFNKEVSKKKKFLFIALLFLSAIVGIYLLSLGFGGRFEERGDFSTDDSVLARINIWDVFLYNDISVFLWGMSGDDAEDMAFALIGMAHIENWFILSSMLVGLVVTSIVVFLFIPLFKNSLKPYSNFVKLLILIVVVGLSSTNNSLACGVPALATFFVCSRAFMDDEQEESAETEVETTDN